MTPTSTFRPPQATPPQATPLQATLLQATLLQATPLAAANDNLPDVVPMPPRRVWDVYRVARRGQFVGRVCAVDADAAIRAAAVAFDADISKLIAMRRW